MFALLTIIILAVDWLSPRISADDVVNFDWTSLTRPTSVLALESGRNLHKFTLERETGYPDKFRFNRIHNRNDDDLIESEFGTFVKTPTNLKNRRRRPKFQTANTNNNNNQKINNPKNDTTKSQINKIMKNYLAKIYLKKFNNNQVGGDINNPQESKFLDSSLWTLKNKTTSLKNKLFSLFTVVKFPNAQCQATASSGSYLGVCYHQTECDLMNGTAAGSCADGYGVCCIYRNTCGGSASNQNCTYFESPGYPNYDPSGPDVVVPTTPPPGTNGAPTPDPRLTFYNYKYINSSRRRKRQTDTSLSCSFSVNKLNANIQQMRIDFIDLELKGPNDDGNCEDERLIITGQNINQQIPVICGYNTGQHIYVDVSMLMGPLQLSVLSNTGERKRFKIQICQIAAPCPSNSNCLQYYTGVTGTISSFNYDQTAVNRSSPGYFNNLNYAICIRREAGYCSITYTNMPAAMEYPFQFRNVDDNGNSVTPPGQAGAEIFNCPDDYIVIGGERLCGDKFNDGAIVDDFTMNAPITDNGAGPIIVSVRTDSAVTGRGFKLFYTQNRCT